MTEQPQDPVAAAGKLSDALDKTTREVRRLNEYGRTSRHLILALMVSMALDLILTAVVAITAVQAHSASERAAAATATAKSAYASNYALCQASNTAREQQIGLWDFLLALGKTTQAPAQVKTVDEFKTYLHRVFAPRDCAALGRKK